MTKPQIAGKIFPVALRKRQESVAFRRLSLLNTDKLHPGNEAFPLLGFHDETLAPKHTIHLDAGESKIIFLIPVYGLIEYKLNGQVFVIKPGTIFVQSLSRGDIAEISNPHSNELINYLRIDAATDAAFPISKQINFFSLDTPYNKNKLVEIYKTGLPAVSCSFRKISMGKPKERTDVNYPLQNNMDVKCLFYVIEGAFEIGGRLLHSRDGLMLWNTCKVEIEALSRDAIIILLEYGYSKD